MSELLQGGETQPLRPTAVLPAFWSSFWWPLWPEASITAKCNPHDCRGPKGP